MKSRLVVAIALVAVATAARAQGTVVNAALPGLKSAPTLQDSLVLMERQSWVAWKDHDAKYFQDFLSDDHSDVGSSGTISKSAVVAFFGTPACKVESYTVDSFKITRLSDDAALLVYRADQNTTCGTAKVPSPTWSSAVYVKRNGIWSQALFQQTTIGH